MYTSVLDEVIQEVNEGTQPEKALRVSLTGLRKIENMRHLMVNLLEVVKRGESLQGALKRLNEAGLIDGNV